MRRLLRWRIGGQVAALVALLGLVGVQPIEAQPRQPIGPSAFGRGATTSAASRASSGSLRRGVPPTTAGRPGSASPLGRAGIITSTTRSMPHQRHRRTNIIIPGQATPGRGGIIRPGAPTPDPNRRIIRPGEERRNANRRLILPGQPENGAEPREPLIVPVSGRSVDAMARALRSVGEHRLAATLCQQAGGCSDPRSPRTLSADVRRGAISIRLPVETRRVIYSANNRVAPNEDNEDGELTQMPRLTKVHGRRDPIAQRAYDKAGVILSFYRTVLGRRSFDDRNSTVRFVVHYGEDEDNAAWNSANESDFGHPIATYGDGNEESRAQIEGEIPYHEFTHGVVDYEANFEYEGESGALHEHFADALGETAQQWERGESVHESDWRFGEGTFHVGSRDGATRSFSNPNLYGQPAHVREMGRVDRTQDNGGVHDLSGVPNRAFYGAAMRLGGHTWEHVGVIWYAALRDHLGRHATFRDCAAATMRSAVELFGPRSREAAAVRAGWADVGIRVPLGRGGIPSVRPQVRVPQPPVGAAPDGE